ncbi:MAG: TRAP transporter TatT component family protein [Gammaproteobacteria bacterium]
MASRTSDSFPESLSRAELQQNDPETVRQGAPALLLMLDGLISSDPDNQALLLSGSRLFSLYSANIAYPDCESWKTGHFLLPWNTTSATGERR